MTQIERYQPSDEEARRLAKGLAYLCCSPVKFMGVGGYDKPVTLADVIRIGGMLVGGLNAATVNPELKENIREMAANLGQFVYDQDGMEEFIFTRIKERADDPDEINKAITFVDEEASRSGFMRRFMKDIFIEALPKGRPGRPTEFNPAIDPGKFLTLASALIPFCDEFLGLKEKHPRKTIKEIIDFLSPEDPKVAGIVRKHAGHISKTITELEFRILKSQSTKARRLAEALTGKELFDWSYTYAIQRGGEFRRATGNDPEE